MTITQLIKELETILQAEGDIEVWYYGRDEASPSEKLFVEEGDAGEKRIQIQ